MGSELSIQWRGVFPHTRDMIRGHHLHTKVGLIFGQLIFSLLKTHFFQQKVLRKTSVLKNVFLSSLIS